MEPIVASGKVLISPYTVEGEKKGDGKGGKAGDSKGKNGTERAKGKGSGKHNVDFPDKFGPT